MKTTTTILSLVSLIGAIGACGGPEHKGRAQQQEEVRVAMQPLLSPVLFDSGDPAQALISGRWSPIEGSAEGVLEIVAGARGSVLRIADSRLWLRSGAHVRVGQSEEGSLIVDLLRGQARIQSSAGHVVRGRELLAMKGRDLLLSHQGPRTKVIETRLRPRNAGWSLELQRPPEERGVGKLEAGEDKSQSPLALRRLSVKVELAGGMAITEVEHVFYNDSEQQLEGTFRFPAPDGVMVTGLAMEIGGRLMEGEFVERAKAREVYESIVDQMQDPALLEWQQGGWFKLRVFPIEAKSEKRVVLRYAAPLQPSIEGYEYRYLTTPPEQSEVGHFELRLDGKLVSEAKALDRAKDVVLTFPESAVPEIVGQEQGEYAYRALTIHPDWQAAPEPVASGSPRRVVLALDSSRSAIENRELSIEVLRMVLGELAPRDRFALFAHDIAPREEFMGFVPATAENVERAISFYTDLSLDGASDLGATLQYAASLAKGHTNTQLIYVGDGTPTWGKTSDEDLQREARALGTTPLFAAVLGRGASVDLWRSLSGSKGGTVVRPHTAMEARKLAFFLGRATEMPRIEQARIQPMPGVELFPKTPRTLFAGESMRVVLRAPKDKMPSELRLEGMMGGKSMTQSMALQAPLQPAALVAKRWASEEIARMQNEAGDKEQIVEMSREFGVLSKYTSLLVLESEEAYQQHQIERKNAEAQRLAAQAPQVSGGDLDNLNGPEASLSPDHIQPGDPEVRIPAPADARSVVLIFPFGDTKIAHWDEEAQTWVARFLIDTDTEDGLYWVRVNIEHANGSLEQLKLPYTVDTTPPDVDLELTALDSKRFRLTVRQNAASGASAEAAAELFDASRVEVQLPWGETRRLYRKEEGLFRGVLRAPMALGESVSLRLVVTDRALNQRVLDIELPVRR